jgi:hypothetical protein
MNSALSACEKAVFVALAAGVSGAAVQQHVPQETAAPIVIIGDLEAEPLGGKGNTDRDIGLSITTIDQAEQRKPALALMDQVNSVLDQATLTEAGWIFHLWLESESAVLLGDGKTYEGLQRYRVMATR